jgi:hypoxanthine phosphoribosyltransferase
MDAHDVSDDLTKVLFTEAQIRQRLSELARQIESDFAAEIEADQPPLLVGVLTGAVMMMADLAREFTFHAEMDLMALSSYGALTESSGVVRILKDLDTDITGRDVLIVEDIIDTGLTLHWLLENLRARNPRSVRVCALLRKPDAAKVDVHADYVGFEIANEFVVGYGLDYDQRYRNLREIGVLSPSAIRPTEG